MVDILVRPAELRQISEQLKSGAKKIDAALQAIDNDILSLKGDQFLGNRANAVQGHYAPKREALLKAKEIVAHFAADLQSAASRFEQADQSGEKGNAQMKTYLDNMRGLAEKVDGYYAETAPDVQIIKIGENDYLIMLPGTKGGNNWNNWGAAITTGMGVETPFERQIRDLIRNKIPPGSNIHFAGHSQGGILAQNLVEHESDGALKDYNIRSVTTFGSPDSAYRVNGVNYQSYELLGDPVAVLDQDKLNLAGIPLAVGIFGGDMLGNTALGMGAFEPHGLYDQVIAHDNLPFAVTKWTVVSSDYAQVATTGLAGFETALHSGDPLLIFEDGAFEIPRGVTMGVIIAGSNTLEYVVNLASPDIAQQIDHVSEGALRYISEFDEVQFISDVRDTTVHVGGQVIQVAGDAVDTVGNTVKGAADAVGSGVSNFVNGAGNFIGGLFD